MNNDDRPYVTESDKLLANLWDLIGTVKVGFDPAWDAVVLYIGNLEEKNRQMVQAIAEYGSPLK